MKRVTFTVDKEIDAPTIGFLSIETVFRKGEQAEGIYHPDGIIRAYSFHAERYVSIDADHVTII